MPNSERALLWALPWLVAGLAASLPLLLVETGANLTTWFLVHLSVLVAFGLALTWRLIPLADATWFAGAGWSTRLRLAASGIVVVVLVTGTIALVTLASSAAMRYDPSTQFLQLLSALDIAWAGSAIMIGAHRAWGIGWSVVGGVALGVFCVWSIWNYLDTVGFGPDGDWIVSGSDLMRLVIPYDMAAAMVAVVIFTIGVVRADQATEQASPQS